MNQLFQGFGEENMGEIKLLTFSYFQWIWNSAWQSIILVNDIHFAKVYFPCQNPTILHYTVNRSLGNITKEVWIVLLNINHNPE